MAREQVDTARLVLQLSAETNIIGEESEGRRGLVRYGSEHGRHFLGRVIHERPVVAGALDEKCDVHPGTSRYVSGRR